MLLDNELSSKHAKIRYGYRKKEVWAGEEAQQLMSTATRPGELHSIPGADLVEENNCCPQGPNRIAANQHLIKAEAGTT